MLDGKRTTINIVTLGRLLALDDGFSMAQLRTLLLTTDRGINGMSKADLQSALKVSGSTVNRIITSLEGLDLISKGSYKANFLGRPSLVVHATDLARKTLAVK